MSFSRLQHMKHGKRSVQALRRQVRFNSITQKVKLSYRELHAEMEIIYYVAIYHYSVYI